MIFIYIIFCIYFSVFIWHSNFFLSFLHFLQINLTQVGCNKVMFPFQVTHLAKKKYSPASKNWKGVSFQGDGLRNEHLFLFSSFKKQNLTLKKKNKKALHVYKWVTKFYYVHQFSGKEIYRY